MIATAAPGSVRGQFASPHARGIDAGRLRGYWQDAATGYTLELEMPLSFTGGRRGLYVIDARRGGDRPRYTAGNTTPLDSGPPPWFIYNPPALQQALAPFHDMGSELHVVDRLHWVVGTPGDTSPDAPRGAPPARTRRRAGRTEAPVGPRAASCGRVPLRLPG